MDYLLTYADRGFSGNPYDTGADRTYSMDVLPQEFPHTGLGDYRNVACTVVNADQSRCCDLRYAGHEIRKGKYSLKGLPAVYADESEAETLEITLKDAVSQVEVALLYGVLPEADIITRSAVVKTEAAIPFILKSCKAPAWILWEVIMISSHSMEGTVWTGCIRDIIWHMELPESEAGEELPVISTIRC